MKTYSYRPSQYLRTYGGKNHFFCGTYVVKNKIRSPVNYAERLIMQWYQ